MGRMAANQSDCSCHSSFSITISSLVVNSIVSAYSQGLCTDLYTSFPQEGLEIRILILVDIFSVCENL